MPQDMWGGQGTTWEGGRVAIGGHWFPPSTIYISRIWTEVVSLGSKLLPLWITSVAAELVLLLYPFMAPCLLGQGCNIWNNCYGIQGKSQSCDDNSCAFPGRQSLLLAFWCAQVKESLLQFLLVGFGVAHKTATFDLTSYHLQICPVPYKLVRSSQGPGF